MVVKQKHAMSCSTNTNDSVEVAETATAATTDVNDSHTPTSQPTPATVSDDDSVMVNFENVGSEKPAGTSTLRHRVSSTTSSTPEQTPPLSGRKINKSTLAIFESTAAGTKSSPSLARAGSRIQDKLATFNKAPEPTPAPPKREFKIWDRAQQAQQLAEGTLLAGQRAKDKDADVQERASRLNAKHEEEEAEVARKKNASNDSADS